VEAALTFTTATQLAIAVNPGSFTAQVCTAVFSQMLPIGLSSVGFYSCRAPLGTDLFPFFPNVNIGSSFDILRQRFRQC
jgi:hypothetical protein